MTRCCCRCASSHVCSIPPCDLSLSLLRSSILTLTHATRFHTMHAHICYTHRCDGRCSERRRRVVALAARFASVDAATCRREAAVAGARSRTIRQRCTQAAATATSKREQWQWQRERERLAAAAPRVERAQQSHGGAAREEERQAPRNGRDRTCLLRSSGLRSTIVSDASCSHSHPQEAKLKRLLAMAKRSIDNSKQELAAKDAALVELREQVRQRYNGYL